MAGSRSVREHHGALVFQIAADGNAVRDPFEVDQVTYRMLHVCVKTSEWLAATERERLDYNSIFRADFAKVKSIVEKIAGALPEEWIKDDQYMKDGFWRFFFDLDESTGLYSFRDELPSALRDCCVECPYDKTVNLHLAEDDGRFNLAFVATGPPVRIIPFQSRRRAYGRR